MVLVFGADGNVGSNLLNHLKVKNKKASGLARMHVDIRSELCINRAIKQLNPEVVINCVAITDVDWCEDNKEAAMNTNGYYVDYLASASRRLNAKFIHISTDYVFDGSGSDAYTEESKTNPINVYGESKLLGEEIALKNYGVVGRVQWVLGYKRQNYLDWIVDKINKREEISLTQDQYGGPTDVNFISECITICSESKYKGELFHWSVDDYASRYDVAIYVAELAGADKSLIKPVSGINFGKAKRPLNTRMDNSKFKRHFGISGLSTWKQQIDNYLRCKYGFFGK